jgi:ribosomal protein S18 acetylase RimI-like enzyme
MALQITEIGTENWSAYFAVSPAFLVESIFECETVSGGLGGIALKERAETRPYMKYDQSERHAEWGQHFDLRTWGIFLATDSGKTVGGAAVAPPSPRMVISQGQPDTAALFDIRVSVSARHGGVGSALLHHCVQWAKSRGFKFLVIETQENNVPACRFYAKNGCELLEIRRFAYRHCPQVAHETMLIWRLAL